MDGENWIVIATGDSIEGSRIKQMFESSRLSNPVACFSSSMELTDYLRKPGDKSAAKMAIPKLLMLDLALPGKEPLEILRMIKGDKQLQDLPVIALCNDGCMSKIDTALELGASTYLPSGFSFADFFERTRFLHGQWTITR